MAFDIYVGGFSRFYSREWENVVQRWARENDTPYTLIGPGGEVEGADWDEVAEAVGHWQNAMNQALGEHFDTPLHWDESRDAPYFTDRPGYDGYGALLVWAAHAERGSTPPEEYDGEWFTDEAFQECVEPKEGQKYRPIVSGSLWLPGDFPFSFKGGDITGETAHICSNRSLLESLEALNAETFRLSENDLQEALENGLGDTPNLKAAALFGFAIFHKLARHSVDAHLPIILSN